MGTYMGGKQQAMRCYSRMAKFLVLLMIVLSATCTSMNRMVVIPTDVEYDFENTTKFDFGK